MRRLLTAALMLSASPLAAAELWCMPDRICRVDGTCKPTTDEETSVRLADLGLDTTTLRSNAEDIVMTRSPTATGAEWRGVNSWGASELLIWTEADMSFDYSVTGADGTGLRASGRCEVQ